ncbi:MAG: GNAT family N-acetyltransferase [Anaerolineales bacterium]|nr:GNAT family N-acetyltransferase [Anaerolineales bacterium]
MSKDIFTGELVRLSAVEAEQAAKAFTEWSQDSEYQRLLDSEPARLHSAKATKKWIEEELKEKAPPDFFWFLIHRLEDNQILGDITLGSLRWNNREAFIGIGIGDRSHWGKGYGTDAMHILLRYAFTELNLERLSLNVFGYNSRGIRTYEKVGFRVEGRQRQYLLRNNQRYDLIYMGILQEEWMQLYKP